MCRLMAYSSKTPVNLPEFMGQGFSDFLKLSEVHNDSWGLALANPDSATVIKEVASAAFSARFSEVISNQSAPGALLHFRWASPGLGVTHENAHPFSFEDIAFIHNGALSPYEAVKSLIAPEFESLREGDTDSELFFLYLLTEIKSNGFVDGVVKGIENLKQNFEYSSINSMIINSDYLIVVSEHDPLNKPSWTDDLYYQLRYRIDENGVAVASSGWDQSGWILMENHSILIVNRHDLTHQVKVI